MNSGTQQPDPFRLHSRRGAYRFTLTMTPEQPEQPVRVSAPAPVEIPTRGQAVAFAFELLPKRADAGRIAEDWLTGFAQNPRPDWRRSVARVLLSGRHAR